MFGEIYWWMGQPSKLHPQMDQPTVDACDVWVIAFYLGNRPSDDSGFSGDFDADAAVLIAERMAEAQAGQVAH